ncbi:MAG TPA: hypothetical protein VK668_10280 [Mucilaginibacter sp.]|nr:hypothetical protein [Mucilaginibacter sp.]
MTLKKPALLLLIILYAGICHAQDNDKKIQISAGTGYQREDFHWSIAGDINGKNPNIYSELKWKAIAGPRYDLALQWNIWNSFLLLGNYSRSSITSGTSNDTDYSGDNRTAPVYNQDFSSNKGSTSAWSAGIGYMLIKNKIFCLSPYLGYGINQQTYYLLGSNGNFNNLNTTYKTHSQGPFLKVISAIKVANKLKVAADLTYSQVIYRAAADWNLIETFQHPVSFRHSANGYGMDADAKLVYSITPLLSANIGAAYFHWETGTGTDQLYLTTGETDKTQLNEVVRNGFRVQLGLNFSIW